MIISISSLVHTFRFTYAADDDADVVADEVVDVAADCNWFVVDGGGWLLPAGSSVAVAMQRGSSSFMILLLISLGGRVVEVDLFWFMMAPNMLEVVSFIYNWTQIVWLRFFLCL